MGLLPILNPNISVDEDEEIVKSISERKSEPQ